MIVEKDLKEELSQLEARILDLRGCL